MAREATPFVTLKSLPKVLPDGLAIVHKSVTLKSFNADGSPNMIPKLDKNGKPETGKDGKPVLTQKTEECVVELLGWTDRAGLIAYEKLRSDNGASTDFTPATVFSEHVSGVCARLTLENRDESARILPPTPSVRLVDLATAIGDVVGQKVTEMVKAGKIPSNADLARFYAEAAGA